MAGDPETRTDPNSELLISRVGDVMVLSGPTPTLPAVLSHAERELVVALIAGRSNAQIAESRATSVKTVANQLYSIYRKLGVDTREQLVALVLDGTAASDR